MKKKRLGLIGCLLAGGAISFGGCASFTESKWYPKDYQNRPVGQYAVESWKKTGEDLSDIKTVYKAPIRMVSSVLATANDAVELPIRGITNALSQATKPIPLFPAIDYGLNTAFDSVVGGNDFNDSYGRLFNFTEGEIYERFVPGFFTRSYQGVYERAKLEGKLASIPPTQKLRVGIEGIIKTILKLLIIPVGGGGGGGGPAGPTPPRPPPRPPF
jgi:hypothetical protein